MTSSDAVEMQAEQIKQRLAAGHSSKAEGALKNLIGELTSEELRAKESLVRTLSSMFLPAHKARHRRIEDLISRRSTATSDVHSATTPREPDAVQQHNDPFNAPRKQPIGSLVAQGTKESEFAQLVAEMRPLGFTKSSQVSSYIVKHRLGNKYGHISGLLTMEQGGERWKFNGGFPPRVYARLCDELGLSNQGTTARPVDFVPFSALE